MHLVTFGKPMLYHLVTSSENQSYIKCTKSQNDAKLQMLGRWPCRIYIYLFSLWAKPRVQPNDTADDKLAAMIADSNRDDKGRMVKKYTVYTTHQTAIRQWPRTRTRQHLSNHTHMYKQRLRRRPILRTSAVRRMWGVRNF